MKNKANTFCFSLLTGRSPRLRHWNELIGKAWEKERQHGGKEGRVWGLRNDSKKGGGEKGRKEGKEEGMKRGRRKG